MKQSLLPDGDLYLWEPFSVPGKKPACELAMTIESIRATLLENGYKILEEKKNKNWDIMMFHCKPN
jgi:hypothetical protein